MLHKISPAFKVASIYLIFSLIWIFTSDSVVASMTSDIETLNFLQTIKGWVFVTATSLLIFFLTNRYIQKQMALNNELKKKSEELETIIQSLPIPTMVFNQRGEILIVNKILLQLSGYGFNEIDSLEKWMRNAYKREKYLPDSEISQLCDIKTLTDNGEQSVFSKDNKEMTWHFNSLPLARKDKEKIIIMSAIDITELKKKNRLLIQQSKMAALGEMIENIAHQWRQPLSSISTLSTGLELKHELGALEDGYLEESLNTINENTQYLSNTINDFKNFFNKDKDKTDFDLKDLMDKSIEIIKPRLTNHNVEVVQRVKSLQLHSFENELIQVFINLFNNSIDALKEYTTNDRLILIASQIMEDKLIITVKDSAGGIDKEIINKIFEPYFTTKHKSQGTGIGLFMSEEIIAKNLHGTIEVCNETFKYNAKEYTGASFIITLPLEED